MAPQVLIPLDLSFRCHVLRKHGATNNENEKIRFTTELWHVAPGCSAGIFVPTIKYADMRENRIICGHSLAAIRPD